MTRSHFTQKLLIVCAFVGGAIGASSSALAAEKCVAPQNPWDVRACELVRQGSVDGLRHYIQRTQGIYGLYIGDYVSIGGEGTYLNDKTQSAANRGEEKSSQQASVQSGNAKDVLASK